MASTLLDNLVAYWPLWEASGTRQDAHGANDLTDNNTVTGNPGKVRSASQFTAANAEYLSLADNAALSVADIDFAFHLWFYLDSLNAHQYLFAKDIVTTREYLLYVTSANRLEWIVYNSSSVAIATVTHTTVLTTSTWYRAYVYHDSVNNQLGVKLNDTAAQTAATSGTPYDGTQSFTVGDRPTSSLPLNGRICELGLWRGGVLTAEELTRLYNGGRGLEYPFVYDRPARGLLRGAMRGA